MKLNLKDAFGSPKDEFERLAHAWLVTNCGLEGEGVMRSLAQLLRDAQPRSDSGSAGAYHLKRCTICGFTVDTSYEYEKPTAEFTTRGRGRQDSAEAPELREALEWQRNRNNALMITALQRQVDALTIDRDAWKLTAQSFSRAYESATRPASAAWEWPSAMNIELACEELFEGAEPLYGRTAHGNVRISWLDITENEQNGWRHRMARILRAAATAPQMRAIIQPKG